jgi:hypothetical protein
MSNIELIESPPSTPLATTGSVTPADLLRIAVERGDADLDRMERLAVMVREWRAEEARLACARDFAAFTRRGITIPKTKRVQQRAKGGGPGPQYDQTEFHVVSSMLKPALGEHGFSVSFDNKFERATDGGIAWCRVTCILEHRDGHRKTLTLEGPPDDSGAKNALQEMQSSATFLMRHALLAITGTAQAGVDNDGRGARGDVEPESDPDAPTLQAGRDAAMQGMAQLTAWWGALTPKQRNRWGDEFKAMRGAAQRADAAGRRE